MTDKRMTDERLAFIESRYGGMELIDELLKALKAEREYLEQHICAEAENEQRIIELENKIERVRRCQRYDYGEFDAPAYPCSDGGLLLYSDVLEALADD